MRIHARLSDYFVDELNSLRCDDLTKSYIVSIFSKFKSDNDDYSKESLTLKYAEAKYKHEFIAFQNLGDFLFFINALFPEYLNNASINYYHSIGQLSYYSCYTIINKQMKVYERLSDEFVFLSNTSGEIIRAHQNHI